MAEIRSNANILKGDQLWLFVAKDSGDSGTPIPVAFATNCSLNRSLSTNSISSKDHGSSSYVTPGEGSWTASTEALMSINVESGAIGYENCMSLFDENEIVMVQFGYVAGGSTPTKYPSGQNIVDVADATDWEMSDPYWTDSRSIPYKASFNESCSPATKPILLPSTFVSASLDIVTVSVRLQFSTAKSAVNTFVMLAG